MKAVWNLALVVGISLHLILAPVARAESDRDREVRRHAQSAVAELEREGLELQDTAGRPLALADLSANPYQRISLVSRESSEDFRLEAGVARGAKGIAIRLVAYQDGAALARRSLNFTPGEEAEAAKLRFRQTLASFSAEVARKHKVVKATLLNTWLRNFASLFTIGEARASSSAVVGVFVSIVLGAIGLSMAAASIAMTSSKKPESLVASFFLALGAMFFGSLSVAVYAETTTRASGRPLPRD